MWHSNSFGLLKGEKYGIPRFGAKMDWYNHKDHKTQSITKIKIQALPQGHQSAMGRHKERNKNNSLIRPFDLFYLKGSFGPAWCRLPAGKQVVV
jgi:hypothetical protein